MKVNGRFNCTQAPYTYALIKTHQSPLNGWAKIWAATILEANTPLIVKQRKTKTHTHTKLLKQEIWLCFLGCSVWLVAALSSLQNWASSWSYRLKLLRSLEVWCYKWNITFHFISRACVMLQTNQNLTSQPLTFFISIWLPLSCSKLEASRYCSVATRGGGYLKINALVFTIHAAIARRRYGAEEIHVCWSRVAAWVHMCTRTAACKWTHVDCSVLM